MVRKEEVEPDCVGIQAETCPSVTIAIEANHEAVMQRIMVVALQFDWFCDVWVWLCVANSFSSLLNEE